MVNILSDTQNTLVRIQNSLFKFRKFWTVQEKSSKLDFKYNIKEKEILYEQ